MPSVITLKVVVPKTNAQIVICAVFEKKFEFSPPRNGDKTLSLMTLSPSKLHNIFVSKNGALCLSGGVAL
jgi:hypothetical protein